MGSAGCPTAFENALPAAAGEPLIAYSGCLFDLLADTTARELPASKKEREQIVRRLMLQCAAVREHARHASPTDAEKTEVERALLTVEGRFRFVVVEREKAIAADKAFCRSRGQEPGC